ncbi:lipopolysaccharide biosynthesis protein [Flavobacterium chilense]|uniref:Membrane protein involved in the export of O-antigen and teichoic acid n=1 Tax=Flavobacterium chilense TaxID=946677 RepID=A0A1M7GT83_9FLAO|nr:lipopolysaccharide biosynthesis protein [Flavobacterium chilense]SHM19385.1 Membrane protein involved in the export of O-antigen and teichoic acid [Flavobacterium chilense]
MLKTKLIKSAKWNAFGRIFSMISDFSFGIVLARILTPNDFGVVAVLSVFISFIGIFINSGFSQALVREKNVTQKDYSTIFYFNLLIAFLFFAITFYSARFIAQFYNNLQMEHYLRVLSMSLFISALVIVQESILIKNMDFQRISIISIISSVFSGIISIVLAYYDFGIWSLIAKSIVRDLIILLLTAYSIRWWPNLVFSVSSFKKYFRFGVYMLGSSLVSQLYNNIFNLTIGKIFSPATLGYYNRAELFKNTLSQNIDGVISGVSYPALASLQDDKIRFVNYYKNILQLSFYVLSILMIGLMFNAEALVNVLLGKKWLGSIDILQYLCFLGILFPINSITVNSISVTGRSDIYFRFQLYSFFGCLISLGLGSVFGILPMIGCLIFISFLCSIWIVKIFNRLFDFTFLELFKSLKFSFIQLILLGSCFAIINMFKMDYVLGLICNAFFGLLIVISVGIIGKGKEFFFLLDQISLKVIQR